MVEPVATGKPSAALRRVLIPLLGAVHLQLRRLEHERDDHRHERGPRHDGPGHPDGDHLFLLVMAALMIPGGKLTDRYGRKRLFTLGLIVYGIGALLSAVSPGLGVLILGNSIFEGVGTAMLIPPVYILATLLFTETTSRARAFGAIMAAGGVGAAAGPLIGGLITSALSWRWAFVFQAVIIALIVVLSRNVKDPLPADPTRPSTPSAPCCRPSGSSCSSRASWRPTTTSG